MYVILDMFGFLGPSLSFENSRKVAEALLDFCAFVINVMECNGWYAVVWGWLDVLCSIFCTKNLKDN